MTTDRTTVMSVSFTRPFRLEPGGCLHEPGTYEIATTEELIDGLSFAAYRKVACTISLPIRRGLSAGRQIVDVDPQEVAKAMAEDARSTVDESGNA